MKQRHFQYKAEFIVVYNVVSLYKIGTFICLSNCLQGTYISLISLIRMSYTNMYIYIVSVLQEMKFLQIFIKYFTKMILQLPTSWR